MSFSYRGLPALTLLNAVLVLLVLTVAGALALPLSSAWTELRQARNVATLAESDRLPYESGAALLSSRDESQALLLTEARMADPVAGEYLMARQYAWSALESLGAECTSVGSAFTANTPLDTAQQQNIAGFRASVRQSLSNLDDLLVRPGASHALTAATVAARDTIAKLFAYRDEAYAGIGGPNPVSADAWSRNCNAPYSATLNVADAAIAGMADHAAQREHTALLSLIGIAVGMLASMVLSVAALLLVRRRVEMPVRNLTGAIRRLSVHDFTTPVLALPYPDEFGAMALALERLRLASSGMKATARTMPATAWQTSHQDPVAMDAAMQASAAMRTVAAASAEVAASIAEIRRRMSQSGRNTERAAEDAWRSDGMVRALAATTSRIGDVVGAAFELSRQAEQLSDDVSRFTTAIKAA
jgi:methyl-accepting chemotaxis protein